MGEKPEDLQSRKAAGTTVDERAQDEGGGSGIAVSDPGVPSRAGSGPEPAEASNLHSSTANLARGGDPAGPGEPAEGTNLNSSKSNIYRTGGAGTGEPEGEPDAPGARPGPGPS